MRTFETTSKYYRTIFNVTETEIESHIELFDSHDGGNLFPSKRRIITLEDIGFMGMNSTEQFVLKLMLRDDTCRELTGNYAEQVNRAYEKNRGLYPN
jgi:hypothetical protein